MSDVLQCPYCVLRFSTQSELEQHKAIDHPHAAEEAAPAEEVAAAPEQGEPTESAAASGAAKRGGWFKRLFGGS